MKTNLTTILLTALATLGAISLTSGNLSSSTQFGTPRNSDVYMSKNSKSLQVSFTPTVYQAWENVFQVPMDGNGSTWEITDWWQEIDESQWDTQWRVLRAGTGIEDRFSSGQVRNRVHHRGMILHEGDILQVWQWSNNALIRVYASGLFQN